ncbi:MAG TPA: ubiquitin-activating E1 FCCH domain-containing protein [Caulobacteraceae bacterium]|nr:ubiquitin-activating E1 FCCH domain-containing protein [Caulobacteraceae bacterium]
MHHPNRHGRIFANFAQSRRGGVAIIVAIMLPLLIGLVFGVMDYSRLVSSKQILQDSLDAAALYAARSSAVTDADLQTVGAQGLAANVINMHDATLVSSSFTAGSNGQKVIASAQGSLRTTILGLFGTNTLTFGATAEVMRSSKNLEVALILDTTGSMKGQNIIDLKAAASDLLDIVVKPTQTPFYSKVALVPYSMAVNVGTYATQVRGAITAARAITGASKAKTLVITSTGHGFSVGDQIYITGMNGMTDLNGNIYTVSSKTSNTFQISDAGGVVDSRNFGTYISGGAASCYTQGCEYYRFTSATGSTNTFQASTCVTERTGTNAYKDVAPSTTLLGRNYPSTSNPCLPNTITPLSSDKAALKLKVNALQAGGSTGGHIGIAWGWYMVSPNFGYLWPGASAAAAYTAPDLIKAVVLMTDGEYNSVYCNGVIAKDSTTGSGAADLHESCNAANGSSYSQAATLCTNMKNAGVVVYVVGFQVVNTQAARDLVNNCATDAAHVYLPSTGTDLKTAFQAIGLDLSRLRLSQ